MNIVDNNKTDLHKAMEWWDGLGWMTQRWCAEKHYPNEKPLKKLTDAQIEYMWQKVINRPPPPANTDRELKEAEILDKAALELFFAHNPNCSQYNDVNKKIIAGFRKDMEILSIFFEIKPK